jgi:Zn finger protein HypA/HybF involved in hydrogenase expression
MSSSIVVIKVKLEGYKCERCSHVWLPRKYGTKEDPVICPKCKSPYWNRPRESDRK